MNTDKVLALAREAGYSTQIDVRNGLHTENIWGGELETAKVMRFAALIQREMEAENAELRKDAERLDFMESSATVNFGIDSVEFQLTLPNDDSGGYNTIREIIDRARSANDKG